MAELHIELEVSVRSAQLPLGIPVVHIKETRRALYAYLAVYRRYKEQLRDGWEPKRKPALSGYENAMDPDLIRKSGQKLGGGSMTPEEYRQEFCDRVDRKVDRLPPYGREIIKRKLLKPRPGYLKLNDLPSDTEVFMAMKDNGWHAESRYFGDEKAEAIQMLAEMLHLVVFV